MKQTIALQTPGRSDLDQSSLFSFDQFTAARPTAPVIHRDARFLLVRSGSGVIRLQGREYPLSAGSLAAILPWQISEIVRVDEPLACSVIAYHYDTVARAAHLFRGEDGQPMPMARRCWSCPPGSGRRPDALLTAWPGSWVLRPFRRRDSCFPVSMP